MLYTAIQDCRLCSRPSLQVLVDLGLMALTGVFPKTEDAAVPRGPLKLVRCESCGLVQLAHNYRMESLYGDGYGYRSGLNSSMVRHLQGVVTHVERTAAGLAAGDLVIDIGSNDGTLLGSYRREQLRRVGIDPTGSKFRHYYQPGIELIADFFSAAAIRAHVGKQRAAAITSIAMFYDLERPLRFVEEIVEILDDEGIWVFEQSYLPAMLATNSYDTICHEHLEYYSLTQIQYIAEQAGLKIIDLDFSDTNGGSFRVTAAKKNSRHSAAAELVEKVLAEEESLGLQSRAPYEKLRQAMDAHRTLLLSVLRDARSAGKLLLGYGASTKGNVLLQYCGIDRELLPAIAEVNEDKFGSFTPGSGIPIISESEARLRCPDYFLVLPWHFRQSIIERERGFLASGGQLVFPLPNLEVVPAMTAEVTSVSG